MIPATEGPHLRKSALCAALWAGIFVSAGAARAGDIEPTAPGARKQLPVFELSTLDGKTLRSRELRGGVTVITFWATWCTPCKAELAALETYARSLDSKRGSKLRVLAVSTDAPETAASVRGVVLRERWSHVVGLDRAGALSALLNPRGSIPFSLFVDAQGRIAHQHPGYQRGDEDGYRRLLDRMLVE